MANNMLPIRKLTDTNGVKYYPLVAGECVLTTESIVAKANIGGYKKDDVIEKATSIFEIIKKLFEGTPVVVDADLSTTSTNAVENRAIATRIASMDTSINDNLLSNLSLNFNSDGEEKKIELKGKDGAILSSIDASEFVKDGFLESVTLVGKKLKFVFNTDSGKEEINVNLSALDITVDTELKDDSTNPVQNKVIKAAIDGKVTGVMGEAMIFNESDGGGAMYTSESTGIKSFVGVNDPASDNKIAGQLYVVNGDQKTKLNMYDGKFCYIKGENPADDEVKAKRELVVREDLDSKVDTVEGKGLSANDFTDELKTKLEGIDLSTKVDAEQGKGLSTNDFTTEEKTIVNKFVNNAADYLIEIVTSMTDEQKTNFKTALGIA